MNLNIQMCKPVLLTSKVRKPLSYMYQCRSSLSFTDNASFMTNTLLNHAMFCLLKVFFPVDKNVKCFNSRLAEIKLPPNSGTFIIKLNALEYHTSWIKTMHRRLTRRRIHWKYSIEDKSMNFSG